MVINLFSKRKSDGSFILELPNYKIPSLRNALNAAINKGKIFVLQAGKVILSASIILWVLSYFGPGDRFEQIDEKYTTSFSAIKVVYYSSICPNRCPDPK